MEIYKILKEDSDNVLKEDLDFFEIELATGDYDREYINKCLELIKEIRQFRNIKEHNDERINIDNLIENIVIEDEVPVDVQILEKKSNVEEDDVQKETRIKSMIISSRSSNNYKNKFIKIINDNNIQEDFIDKNYVFFKQVELDELIKTIIFSEKFLEKYFKLLNHNLVSEYQLFSEEFYMKHFNQLDYKIVLRKGKNPWIRKDERSSKLTVFLKLKGITL